MGITTASVAQLKCRQQQQQQYLDFWSEGGVRRERPIIVINCISLDHVTVWCLVQSLSSRCCQQKMKKKTKVSWSIVNCYRLFSCHVYSLTRREWQIFPSCNHWTFQLYIWVINFFKPSIYVHYFNHGLNKCTYNRSSLLSWRFYFNFQTLSVKWLKSNQSWL